jgi:hypothetical protein
LNDDEVGRFIAEFDDAPDHVFEVYASFFGELQKHPDRWYRGKDGYVHAFGWLPARKQWFRMVIALTGDADEAVEVVRYGVQRKTDVAILKELGFLPNGDRAEGL